MPYNFREVEAKWRERWEKERPFRARDGDRRKKYYALVEFPYPSGDGLHVGHVRPYVALDIIVRKRRMEGYNVLYPIGWDAFGLPTENYAIKTGIHPAEVTRRNTERFRDQVKALGISFDWDREVNTTDPAYYKWTQWIFLQLFKKGLAYKAKMPINWCPKDKIGLANEEVVGGKCERCGTPVEQREKEQWMLKITAYADKLLKGLDEVDFLPEIKTQQRNWIGRSEGAEIIFPVVIPAEAGIQASHGKEMTEGITVFTTRPDTLFGATYLVVAPEHAFVQSLLQNPKSKIQISNGETVRKYIESACRKTEEERLAEGKEKTGVELKGIKAINPATKEEIPIWVADYVLVSYGTGAIMAVPAHDDRDLEFARKFNLPVKVVIAQVGSSEESEIPGLGEAKLESIVQSGFAHYGDGFLINSGKFNGFDSEQAKWEIAKAVGGERKVQYKLRDWVFSRQRYWGEPIPLVHCEKCGWVPVPEDKLPVELPNVKNYQPRDDGESPLASVSDWVETKCPQCGGKARRETDVMPNWAGSSWYFLRYCDPRNDSRFASSDLLKHWLPVDWYNGGMEHVTLHLLYSRFWNLFLYDEGLVPVAEPYKKRTAHGIILAKGGVKMSKSKGNVVNPDELVAEFGADALRLYEMFIGPFNQAAAWDPHGMLGTSRFLEKVWRLGQDVDKKRDKIPASAGMTDDAEGDLEKLLHKTIKKVSEDIESMAFNTAVSAMMIFVNECERREAVPRAIWREFVRILAPFAPFISHELWEGMGEKNSLDVERWPEFDPALAAGERVTIALQVDGRTRGTMEVERGADEATVRVAALEEPAVKKWIGGKAISRVIFVKDRLMNIVLQ